MPKRSSKKPYEPNATPFSIVQRVTDGTRPPFADTASVLDNEELRKKIMQEMGRRGGQKGGKARAESMTRARRKEIAHKAAMSRWNKLKANQGP